MSYQVHNFQTGEVINATPVNEMDAQIQQNEEDIAGKADKRDTELITTLSRGRRDNTVIGTASVAFGVGVEAIAGSSQAFGTYSKARATNAFAIGFDTVASGYYAFVGGDSSAATGESSFGFGTMVMASGDFSYAQGNYVTANRYAQHVFGSYNVPDASEASTSEKGWYIEIVGNGDALQLHNARTLDWDGNEELAGDLTIFKGLENESKVSDKADKTDLNMKAPVVVHSISNANVASFSDGADNLPSDIFVNIEHRQAGTGTPSTSNVRNMSGFMTISGESSNENMFINEWTLSGTTLSSAYIPIRFADASDKYTFYNCDDFKMYTWAFDSQKNMIGRTSGANRTYQTIDKSSFTTQHSGDDNDICYIQLKYYNVSNTTAADIKANNEIVLLHEDYVSDHLGDYVPAKSIAYDIAIPVTMSEVYDGTLEVDHNGKAKITKTIERETVDPDDLQYSRSSSTAAYVLFEPLKEIDENIIGETNQPVYSNVCVPEAIDQSTVELSFLFSDLGVTSSATGEEILAAIKTFANSLSNGIQLAYKLQDVETVEFETDTINTVYGNGNIWFNCGDIAEINYPADTSLATDLAISIATEAFATKDDTVLGTTLSRGRRGDHEVGEGSFAFGSSVSATGPYSHAEGKMTQANHAFQHVFGTYNIPDPSDAPAAHIGNYVEIVGGGSTVTLSRNLRALKWNGDEHLFGDLYVGCNANSSGGTKVATTVTGATNGNFAGLDANGNLTDSGTAPGDFARKSDTVLTTTLSRGRAASSTVGVGSYAFGDQVTASGFLAHAEGAFTEASGAASHSEGSSTVASGASSHAECSGTMAMGADSHAEGSGTYATGIASHAECYGTTASGTASHADGTNTVANHKSQHVFGEFNVEDDSSAAATARGNYVEIVGNGTASNAKSNARTLDWSGNEVLAGGLEIGNALSCGRKTNTTIGERSVAFGYDVEASGDGAVAFGHDTVANHFGQLVFGVNNVPDPAPSPSSSGGQYLEIVGCGTTTQRNARALGWNGSEYLRGTLYVRCNNDSTGGTEVATKAVTENVSGSTPSITGVDNHRYVCGEVSTLSITAPQTGTIDVVFRSGTTATVLTTSGITWPSWFDSTDLEANTRYEISVDNGYGVVAAWN